MREREREIKKDRRREKEGKRDKREEERMRWRVRDPHNLERENQQTIK